jgi:hypothetical protein
MIEVTSGNASVGPQADDGHHRASVVPTRPGFRAARQVDPIGGAAIEGKSAAC